MTDFETTLTDLQIKIAHLENTTETLSAIIAHQDRELKDLQDQLKILYRLITHAENEGIAPFDPLADRPPHY